MSLTFGFLGCGNMGRPLLDGWLRAERLRPAQVLVAARDSAQSTAAEFGIEAVSVAELVVRADIILLAVKPQYAPDILAPLSFRAEQLVISIMAGTPISRMGVAPARIVRTMPNVGSGIGRGATVAYSGPGVTAEEEDIVTGLFESVGCLEWLGDEDQFHAATALVGSGPAYIFEALHAMAQGATEAGLPANIVARLAAMTVEGAAVLALHSDESALSLRDRVASPGGTTVAALASLEQDGFSAALVAAVHAAAERSRELAPGDK